MTQMLDGCKDDWYEIIEDAKIAHGHFLANALDGVEFVWREGDTLMFRLFDETDTDLYRDTIQRHAPYLCRLIRAYMGGAERSGITFTRARPKPQPA